MRYRSMVLKHLVSATLFILKNYENNKELFVYVG